MVKTKISISKIKKETLEKIQSGVPTRKLAHYLCKKYKSFTGSKREVIKLLNSINPLLALEAERRINKLNHKAKKTINGHQRICSSH